MKTSKKAIAITVMVFMAAYAVMLVKENRIAQAAGKKSVSSVSLKIKNRNVTKKIYKLQLGKTATIKATLLPKSAKQSITYKSTKSSVATVSKNGKMVAKKCGTVKFIATVTGKEKKTTWVKIKIQAKKNKAAEKAYAQILRKKNGGSFKLIYVDDDEIPELAYIAGDGAHLDQVSLYIYKDGKATYLRDLGAYGTLPYSEKNNRIFAYSGTEENEKLEAKYTYMIKNGKLVKAPDHKGYSCTSANGWNSYKNNESNIKLMLSGKLKRSEDRRQRTD